MLISCILIMLFHNWFKNWLLILFFFLSQDWVEHINHIKELSLISELLLHFLVEQFFDFPEFFSRNLLPCVLLAFACHFKHSQFLLKIFTRVFGIILSNDKLYEVLSFGIPKNQLVNVQANKFACLAHSETKCSN